MTTRSPVPPVPACCPPVGFGESVVLWSLVAVPRRRLLQPARLLLPGLSESWNAAGCLRSAFPISEFSFVRISKWILIWSTGHRPQDDAKVADAQCTTSVMASSGSFAVHKEHQFTTQRQPNQSQSLTGRHGGEHTTTAPTHTVDHNTTSQHSFHPTQFTSYPPHLPHHPPQQQESAVLSEGNQ